MSEEETKDLFSLPIGLSFEDYKHVYHQRGKYVFPSCIEYDAFHNWLLERFPSLFAYDGLENELPDGTTLADIDDAIFLISEEYVRRCKAMSSPHVHVDAVLCVHDRFMSAIKDVRKIKRALKYGEAGPVRKMLAREDEEAALRDRKLKAARKDLAEKDKANATLQRRLKEKAEAAATLRREMKALHEKLEEKDEAEAALRHDAKALREKLEEKDEALRKKADEVEEAYRVFRKVVGSSATSQRSSDTPTPSTNNVPSGKIQRDSRPPIWGPPPRRLSAYDLDMDARRRELDKSIGESLNDPGADWGS